MRKYLFIIFSLHHCSAVAQPEKTVSDYLDALRSGDRQKEEQYWMPEAIRRSQSFGTVYREIDAKYDCASPVVLSLNDIRDRKGVILHGSVVDYEGYATVPVSVSTERETVRTIYYLVNSNGTWKITSPLFLFTKDWSSVETDFAIVHFSNRHRINDDAIQGLDDFVKSLCIQFHLPDSSIERLRKEKIAYYVCDDETVQKITGYTTKGIANLQFDAVVSSSLPHYHELTHLFLNYFLHELPLFTLPWLQEGTAVSLGGRWGKSPGVVLTMGNFLFDQQMVSLNDLLTYRGFHSTIGSPDISYPASGLFVHYLLEQYGTDRFLQIYRSLSGSAAEIEQLTADSVQAYITNITGSSWEKISNDFHSFRKRFSAEDIIPGTLPKKRTYRLLSSAGCSAQISENDSTILFDVLLDSSHVHSTLSLLFTSSYPGPEEYFSGLFAEHFPTEHYRGEIYSFRISADEAGLYDYHTDMLLAKYVQNFSPNKDYWNEKSGTIHCMLRKNMLKRELSDYTITLLQQ